MYSKIKIAGHPVHPMLVAFPVACYAGTLAGCSVYAANGHLFWLNLAIALSITGTGTAVLAALVHLIPEQELAEPAVQHSQLSLLHHHAS